MCGILGGVNTSFDDSNLSRLAHRGSDQQAFLNLKSNPRLTISLGQTRLNVVDRNNVNLPLQRDGRSIVMNGQIYNHAELRAELESFGAKFETHTDIEVALAAYQQWGMECLKRFNGMFALAIWDGERFFCARDRMGQKPFFYRIARGTFEFASEIKAFDNLEYAGDEIFDLFEFCFDERTLYQDILSLRPGHWLVFDAQTAACRTGAYWNLDECAEGVISDERAALNHFIELLEDSVRLRMRADAAISMFLAGGLDSSLIAALARPEEAFTCQFDEFRERINEEQFASDLALRLGIRLQVIRPTRRQFLDDFSAMSRHLEMPTGSFSVFPIYRLAATAHDAGYKVILTGDGSDELFAGYVRSELLLRESTGPNDTKSAHYASMMRRYQGDALDRYCRMASRSGLIGAGLMKIRLADLWTSRRSTVQNMCHIESRIFLQPLLQMADRMCMAHGVENRCPFLDHRIIEFAFSLHDSLRFRDGTGKWIVHRAAEKVLPRGSLALTRTVKDGLPTPVNEWLFGRPGFDRRHWNALLLSECIRSLMSRGAALENAATIMERPISDLLPVHSPHETPFDSHLWSMAT
ncbi:MAG: asparagine synthase (glutamine-hydrolyzing) [Planctomycetes bacterium]|nr:asparagine synthase (glutamine-hydrolyzing) [Planctomycetota bacterium]MBI3832845.1 asparagine synthase (glutamine-hydrolyzing) [Planctomycetota bacterium]